MTDISVLIRKKLAERKGQLEYINSGKAIARWKDENGKLIMLEPSDLHYEEAITLYRATVEKEIREIEKQLLGEKP